MMVDNTENNEFRELLSDYAAPIGDVGFSEHVLMQSRAPQNTGAIKNLMVGMAVLFATFSAVPQLGKLKQLLAGVRLPELALPTNIMESASMTIFALLALLIVSLAGSFLFSSDF